MKRFKLIDGTPAHAAAFDWDACIFCQVSDKSELLQCPALSKRTDAGVGYIGLSPAILMVLQSLANYQVLFVCLH